MKPITEVPWIAAVTYIFTDEPANLRRTVARGLIFDVADYLVTVHNAALTKREISAAMSVRVIPTVEYRVPDETATSADSRDADVLAIQNERNDLLVRFVYAVERLHELAGVAEIARREISIDGGALDYTARGRIASHLYLAIERAKNAVKP
jgi:hypothetical protein